MNLLTHTHTRTHACTHIHTLTQYVEHSPDMMAAPEYGCVPRKTRHTGGNGLRPSRVGWEEGRGGGGGGGGGGDDGRVLVLVLVGRVWRGVGVRRSIVLVDLVRVLIAQGCFGCLHHRQAVGKQEFLGGERREREVGRE